MLHEFSIVLDFILVAKYICTSPGICRIYSSFGTLKSYDSKEVTAEEADPWQPYYLLELVGVTLRH